ncbi:hypothetical protein D9M72_651750 [compost metagenome]
MGAGFGQLALDGGFAGQVRVSVDQSQLAGVIGAQQDVAHALVQGFDLVDRSVLAQVEGLFGHPWRMFVDVGEGFDEGVAAQCRGFQCLKGAHFAAPWYGWVCCQWRAMSTRRLNHTCS